MFTELPQFFPRGYKVQISIFGGWDIFNRSGSVPIAVGYSIGAVDINGQPRAMLIPEYELENALKRGVGFDGSSVEGFAEIESSDLIANPDPSTFLIPMWAASRS